MSSQTNLEQQRIQHMSCIDECRQRIELLEITCQKSIRSHEEINEHNSWKTTAHSCNQQCSVHVEQFAHCNESLSMCINRSGMITLRRRYASRERELTKEVAMLQSKEHFLQENCSLKLWEKICITFVLAAVCIYTVSATQRCFKLVKSNEELQEKAQNLTKEKRENSIEQTLLKQQLEERSQIIVDLQERRTLLDGEVRLKHDQLEEMQQNMKEMQQRDDQKDKQTKQTALEFQEKERSMESQLKDIRESLVKEVVESHKKVQHREDEMKEMKQKMRQLQRSDVIVSNMRATLQEKEDNLLECERQIDDLHGKLAVTEEMYNNTIRQLQSELERCLASTRDSSRSIKIKHTNDMESQRISYEEEVANLRDKYSKACEDVKHLQVQLKSKDKEKCELLAQNEEKEHSLKQYQDEIERQRKHSHFWDKANKKKEKEIREFRKKISDLSNTIDLFQTKDNDREKELQKSRQFEHKCLELQLQVQHSDKLLKLEIERSETAQREVDILRKTLSDPTAGFKLQRKSKSMERKASEIEKIAQDLLEHRQVTYTRLDEMHKEFRTKYDDLQREYHKVITDTKKEASIMRMERENYLHSKRMDKKRLSMELMFPERVSFSMSLSPTWNK